MLKGTGIFFFFFFSFSGYSIAQVAVVKIKKQPAGNLKPGRTETVVLQVENIGYQADSFSWKIDIPKPFKTTLLPGTKVIDSMSAASFFFNFSIPANCPAGNYTIVAYLYIRKTVVDTVSFTINVEKVSDFEFILKQSDPYVRSGGTIQVEALLSNRGNAREIFLMQGNRDIPLEWRQLSIDPGETREIYFQITAPSDVMRTTDFNYTLKVSADSFENAKTVQRTIKVFPIKSEKPDPFHRFPVNITHSIISRNDRPGVSYQLNLNGNGSLDSAGKHLVEYYYLGPNQDNAARLGMFNQWYVTYQNKNHLLFSIGERSFHGGRLNDINRFGRGIEAAYLGKHFQMEINTVEPRFQREVQRVSSLVLRKVVSDSFSIGSIFTLKQEANIGLTPVVSLGANYNNSRSFLASAEAALSRDPDNNIGYALMYDTRLMREQFGISHSLIYSSAGFRGYFNNSLMINGGLSYQLKRMSLGLGGNINQLNPSLDTVFGAAPYGHNLAPFITYRYQKSNNLSLQTASRQREDRGISKAFFFRESLLRLVWNHYTGNMNFSTTLENGRTINRLTSKSDQFYEGSFQAGYYRQEKFNARVFVQVSRNIRFTNEAETYLIYGGFFTAEISKKGMISAQYQNRFLADQLYTDRSRLDLRAEYVLHKHHVIGVFANQALLFNFNNRGDFIYGANYRIQLNVPTQRIMSLGSLYGRIMVPDGRNPEDLLLFMEGEAAITDENGRFFFNGLKPGQYRLRIDKSSLGIDLIPDTMMPLPVLIEPSVKKEIGIQLIQASRIEGVFVITRPPGYVRSSQNELYMPTILLELSNGQETYLLNNDNKGLFRYYGLKPGKWKLRIIGGVWQKDYSIKEMEQIIELKTGEELRISISLQPKIQKIKFKNSESIEVK